MSANWIQTYTGGRIYPLDPRAEDVDIMDIAHALSNQCRFTGHVREFYSVAQHSVMVSHMCASEDALRGLLHDASEAYLIDLARPIKHDPRMSFFREAEDILQGVIYKRFGLPPDIPESVKIADSRMLMTERRDLLDPIDWSEKEKLHWQVAVEPYEGKITPWLPKEAKTRFLTRFVELTDGLRQAKTKSIPEEEYLEPTLRETGFTDPPSLR